MSWFNKKGNDKEQSQSSLPEMSSNNTSLNLPSAQDFINNSPRGFSPSDMNSNQDLMKQTIENQLGSRMQQDFPKYPTMTIPPPLPPLPSYNRETKQLKPISEGVSIKMNRNYEESIGPQIQKPKEETQIQQSQTAMPKKSEPVYIRIDNFESTIQTFKEIKLKLADIEKVLKDISSVKEKEKQELENWEREIQIIKKRIESMDKGIFSRFE
jgi:hypothetical protein